MATLRGTERVATVLLRSGDEHAARDEPDLRRADRETRGLAVCRSTSAGCARGDLRERLTGCGSFLLWSSGVHVVISAPAVSGISVAGGSGAGRRVFGRGGGAGVRRRCRFRRSLGGPG